MRRLLAKRPILYMGRIYDVGEGLPAYDSLMVDAWLAAGSAERVNDGAVNPDAIQMSRNDQIGNIPIGTDMGIGNIMPETLMEATPVTVPERMKKVDMMKLAEDMGIDISAAKTNQERVAILSAASVQRTTADGGGAQ